MIAITAPASKSVSHRMIIGAAMAAGESIVSGVLESEDLARTIGIFNDCGARIYRQEAGVYSVTGCCGTPAGGIDEPVSCDVHESGTTCRLLTAVLAAGLGKFRIHGAPRMHERPIKELANALSSLTVNVTYEGAEGCPPVVLDTDGLKGSEVSISLEESSQYLSGLLLAAPSTRGLTINLVGNKAVSWPYVGLTLDAMEQFGITFSVEMLEDSEWIEKDWRTFETAVPNKTRFIVKPGMYRNGSYTVEGDWSNASYFLAAGTLGTEPVRIANLHANSLQGDKAMFTILQQMGATLEINDKNVIVHPSKLKGIDVDMGNCPDLVPTVAALAAYAEGSTTIRNVAHLRIKECDRLAAPATELRKAGIDTEVTEDGIIIRPDRKAITAPEGTVFKTYNDHRMAMSLSLLQFALGDIGLDNKACVSKSFPTFWEEWEKVSPCRR
ncbi:3-phosphoshikimate 1-carboxyvinyltransferase [Halodesulfovibrio aestuarii]|uniref:3-phosphoshikimate 1-carboxyvinyltransferase n=1 Tax=Halodesulfovibrio aestuarii TaxID=126333 RepID=UPI00352288E2